MNLLNSDLIKIQNILFKLKKNYTTFRISLVIYTNFIVHEIYYIKKNKTRF